MSDDSSLDDFIECEKRHRLYPEYHKQIVDYLEELKTYRECNVCEYNKALDDIESEFLKCDKVHYNLQDIMCVINKLKGEWRE